MAILQQLGILGLPEEQCCYVALTWDDGPERVFGADTNFQPLFLAETGTTSPNRFTEIQPRYGWLGYQTLEDTFLLDREYRNACHGMIPYPIPQASDYLKSQTTPPLPEEMDTFTWQIAEAFTVQWPGSRLAGEPSSRSIIWRGKVQVKIISRPGENSVFVGIRLETPPAEDIAPLLESRKIQPSVFYGFTFSLDESDLTINPNWQQLMEYADELRKGSP